MTRCLMAALNTLNSNYKTMLFARLLGKRLKVNDQVTKRTLKLISWRGKEYLI